MDEKDRGSSTFRWQSEAECHALTDQIAKELLRDCTLEQLAVVAAQHMIYVDTLKATNSALIEAKNAADDRAKATNEALQLKDEQLRLEVLKSEILANNTARFAKMVLGAKNKKTALSGADARHKESREAMNKAIIDWNANGHTYSSKKSFARLNYKKYFGDFGSQDGEAFYRNLLKRTKKD